MRHRSLGDCGLVGLLGDTPRQRKHESAAQGGSATNWLQAKIYSAKKAWGARKIAIQWLLT